MLPTRLRRFRSLPSVPVQSVAFLFGDSTGPVRPFGPCGLRGEALNRRIDFGYLSLSIRHETDPVTLIASVDSHAPQSPAE
jgi:hypothetical protein